jgi:tetratricopeptide (TPR) repeat protein
LQEAIHRNPNYLVAHTNLAASYLLQWTSQQSVDSQTLGQALVAAQRVLALNTASPWGHGLLDIISLWQKQYEQAIAEMERTVALDPNEATTYAGLAVVLSHVGKSVEAVTMAEQALGRKPLFADTHLGSVGSAYYWAGRTEEAVAPLKQYLARYPNITGCPPNAGGCLQRVRPNRRGAGGGRRSTAAESPFLTRGSQAENAHQRSSGLGAASGSLAQSRA